MQTLNENLGENLGKNLYDNIKYFISSKKPQFTQSEFSKATTFYLSSPYRSANIGTTELAQSIIKFSVLKRIFQEAKEMGAQGDIDFLDAKISFNSGLCEHEFPRDCAFLVGEKLFFPSVKFKEIYKDERLVSREIMLDEIRHSQRFAHLNFQELPFYLEGGNVIVTDLRTDCGERVILFSLSDLNFSGQKYNGSYFLDDRGNVSRIDDIDHAEHMIAKYFKHIGINAIAIRRNLS